jgi:hypothetical protein
MVKILLSIVGLITAIWAWQNVHPILGAVVGILFVGGTGWYLFAGIGARVISPNIRKHGDKFIQAWEQRYGSMQMGAEYTHPPPGLFQTWAKLHKQTGISAEEFLIQLEPPVFSRHVPLYDDGRGATIELRSRSNQQTRWSWRFDEGVVPDLHANIAIDQSIKELEKELGLSKQAPDTSTGLYGPDEKPL